MAIHQLENHLKTYRKRAGISQKEMGFLLGVHDGSKASRYEHFKRTPSLETALACEALFHTPVRELFPGVYARAARKTIRRVRLLRQRLITEGTSAKRKVTLLNQVEGVGDSSIAA